MYTAVVVLVQGYTQVREREPHMAGVELFKLGGHHGSIAVLAWPGTQLLHIPDSLRTSPCYRLCMLHSAHPCVLMPTLGTRPPADSGILFAVPIIVFGFNCHANVSECSAYCAGWLSGGMELC